jgi:hypothetical protein
MGEESVNLIAWEIGLPERWRRATDEEARICAAAAGRRLGASGAGLRREERLGISALQRGDDCPSPQAAELRQWIVEQEKAGISRSEVEEELFRVYGDQLLQAPRAEGMGLMAYLIPALAFVAGGALVVFFLRRQRSSVGGGETAPASTALPDPDLEQLMEEELRRTRS